MPLGWEGTCDSQKNKSTNKSNSRLELDSNLEFQTRTPEQVRVIHNFIYLNRITLNSQAFTLRTVDILVRSKKKQPPK